MSFLRFIKLLCARSVDRLDFLFRRRGGPDRFSPCCPRAPLREWWSAVHWLHLHWIGIVCGLVFLLCSVLLALIEGGHRRFIAAIFCWCS